jgi:large subunit ribosomal protein L16
MSFIPQNSKFRKQHKGKSFNRINKNINYNQLNVGSIGLKTLEASRITSKQLESLKQAVSKIIKKSGRVLFPLFPDTPISKKPLEIRMGKGKGAVDHWIFKLQPGFIICEIETQSYSNAIKALKAAQFRCPTKTKIIFN